MSRQFDEAVASSEYLVGAEMRQLIEPKNVKQLVEAYTLRNQIEWWASCCDEDDSNKDNLEEALRFQTEYIDEYIESLPDFDNAVFVNNITFLINKYGIKIGILEGILGLSAGYISRTINENSKKNMSIDTAWKIAKFFEIDLTILLSFPLDGLGGTDQYYLSFVSKLISDSAEDKLSWTKEKADKLNTLKPTEEGYVWHPMFSVETFYRQDEDYPYQVEEPVFQSDSFGYNTAIYGDCYNLRLKNNSYVYLMDISKAHYRSNDKNAHAKELWIVDYQNKKQIICRNNDGSTLAPLVDRLYEVVMETSKHPKLNDKVKSVIDAFMDDDLDDDPDFLPY